MYWRVFVALLLSVGIVFMPAQAPGDDPPPRSPNQTTYKLRTSVIGAAGGPMQASGFRQKGTLAQPIPVGVCSGSGNKLYAGFWSTWAKTIIGVETGPEIFTNKLFQNYPNPFNPTTTIEFSVAKTEPVEITIYNVKGQRVRQLVNQSKQPGLHQVTWDGTNDRSYHVASGVYFYRIRIGSFSEVKKMVVLK